MATHYNILVWRIPWTEEPGQLQSMGSQRVGHDFHCHPFPVAGEDTVSTHGLPEKMEGNVKMKGQRQPGRESGE